VDSTLLNVESGESEREEPVEAKCEEDSAHVRRSIGDFEAADIRSHLQFCGEGGLTEETCRTNDALSRGPTSFDNQRRRKVRR
jgi:hypothetical protein